MVLRHKEGAGERHRPNRHRLLRLSAPIFASQRQATPLRTWQQTENVALLKVLFSASWYSAKDRELCVQAPSLEG
jgi:hypothetical protein